ncbi:Protein kinase-like domain [Pseudocohnilembus persalinus]|uniref:Protein kinase-like domain n=1 Tax=Pseudocohnilembus persalinus TaxID=266149 RepID=A0A0V0QXH7_PSEPJ|nr:Protein kinase-like domain [Pseudocohnilembus persalinus]|eukprot:KRX07039.1 Protein kinase-like domain [Pseudocohnilembus persalinus]
MGYQEEKDDKFTALPPELSIKFSQKNGINQESELWIIGCIYFYILLGIYLFSIYNNYSMLEQIIKYTQTDPKNYGFKIENYLNDFFCYIKANDLENQFPINFVEKMQVKVNQISENSLQLLKDIFKYEAKTFTISLPKDLVKFYSNGKRLNKELNIKEQNLQSKGTHLITWEIYIDLDTQNNDINDQNQNNLMQNNFTEKTINQSDDYKYNYNQNQNKNQIQSQNQIFQPQVQEQEEEKQNNDQIEDHKEEEEEEEEEEEQEQEQEEESKFQTKKKQPHKLSSKNGQMINYFQETVNQNKNQSQKISQNLNGNVNENEQNNGINSNEKGDSPSQIVKPKQYTFSEAKRNSQDLKIFNYFMYSKNKDTPSPQKDRERGASTPKLQASPEEGKISIFGGFKESQNLQDNINQFSPLQNTRKGIPEIQEIQEIQEIRENKSDNIKSDNLSQSHYELNQNLLKMIKIQSESLNSNNNDNFPQQQQKQQELDQLSKQPQSDPQSPAKVHNRQLTKQKSQILSHKKEKENSQINQNFNYKSPDLKKIYSKNYLQQQQISQEKQYIQQEKQHISQEKQHISQEKQHIQQEKQHISQEKQHIQQEKQYIQQESHKIPKSASVQQKQQKKELFQRKFLQYNRNNSCSPQNLENSLNLDHFTQSQDFSSSKCFSYNMTNQQHFNQNINTKQQLKTLGEISQITSNNNYINIHDQNEGQQEEGEYLKLLQLKNSNHNLSKKKQDFNQSQNEMNCQNLNISSSLPILKNQNFQTRSGFSPLRRSTQYKSSQQVSYSPDANQIQQQKNLDEINNQIQFNDIINDILIENQIHQQETLKTPLTCKVEYLGFQILCTAKLPISYSDSLINGPQKNDEKYLIHSPLTQVIKQLGENLNLKQYSCWLKNQNKLDIFLSYDTEFHASLEEPWEELKKIYQNNIKNNKSNNGNNLFIVRNKNTSEKQNQKSDNEQLKSSDDLESTNKSKKQNKNQTQKGEKEEQEKAHKQRKNTLFNYKPDFYYILNVTHIMPVQIDILNPEKENIFIQKLRPEFVKNFTLNGENNKTPLSSGAIMNNINCTEQQSDDKMIAIASQQLIKVHLPNLIKKHPLSASIYSIQAKNLIENDNFKESFEMLEKALNIYKNSIGLSHLQAYIMEKIRFLSQ